MDLERISMLNHIDDAPGAWLDSHADALDSDNTHADQSLATLAASRLFKVAVPVAQGATGGGPVPPLRLQRRSPNVRWQRHSCSGPSAR